MPAPTSDRGSVAYWTKTALLIVLLAAAGTVFVLRFPALSAGSDFPDFYCGSRLVMEGHGHQLYDAALQRQCQARAGGSSGTLYIHPPFETLVYLAVAWLPMQRAYALWCLLNLLLLALAIRQLAWHAGLAKNWKLLFALSLIFVPVLLSFLQGQDSLLLLLLIVLAFKALEDERGWAAGVWLGLGLFKFQLVLPLTLVSLLGRAKSRKSLLGGFALTGLALALLSAGLSGLPVFTAYPRFLLHLRELPLAGANPNAMANLRGLVFLMFADEHSRSAVAALTVLSVIAFGATLLGWHSLRKGRQNFSRGGEPGYSLAFANSVIFAVLVGYHVNPHDLSLLLLPLAMGRFQSGAEVNHSGVTLRWVIALAWLVLFLPPLHLFALHTHVYVYVVAPVVVLFGSVLMELLRGGTITRTGQS